MVITPPQPDEVEKLVALAQVTGFFNPDEITIVREMLDEYFEQGSHDAQAMPDFDEYRWEVYRAAPGGPPLGFVCYGTVSMSDNVYDLYWIAVDRSYQDKKIGSALLEHVENNLKKWNARHLYIETSDKPQYVPTRAFYVRRGYQEVAHLTDYYHVGDGKVIYRKVFRER